MADQKDDSTKRDVRLCRVLTRGPRPKTTSRLYYVTDVQLPDPQTDPPSQVSIRNEKSELTRYPAPDETMPMTPGDRELEPSGVDLEDVVVLNDGTSATIISTDASYGDQQVVAVVHGDLPTVTGAGPNVQVDEYYNGDGSSVFVLTDGDAVIGVRG